MAVNEKNNVVLNGYQRGSTPVLEEERHPLSTGRTSTIENSIRSLVVAGVEVLDEPPKNPIKGMLKYNISPWDALGDGSEGLVLYNGNAWINV